MVPPVSVEARIAKYIAKVYVFCPGREVRVQVMDYAPLSYAPGRRPFYAVIDNAVRSAVARGVKVKLMVSNWNTEEPAIDHLKSLAMLPGIEIRIVKDGAVAPPAITVRVCESLSCEMAGARDLLNGTPDRVAAVDLPALAHDLDTPADYAAATRSA